VNTWEHGTRIRSIWADGDKYDGTYQNNVIHGQGPFTDSAEWTFTCALVREWRRLAC